MRKTASGSGRILLLSALSTGFLAAGLLAGPLPLLAQPTTQEQLSQTTEKIQELQQRSQEAKDALAAANEKKSALGKKLDELNEQLDQVNSDLAGIQSDIDEKNAQITESTEVLERLEETRQRQYEAMKVRIRFLYERGDVSLLESLLGAGSMSELLNRVEYFSQVMAYDREQLTAYQQLLTEQQNTTETLEQEKQELLALQAEQGEKQEELTRLVADARSELQTAAEDADAAADLLDGVDTQLDQQLAYEQALEEQKAAEDQARLEEIRQQEEALKQQQEEQRRQEEQQKNNNDNNNDGASTAGTGSQDASDASAQATDLELLAAIIQCEADSEPYEGKLAVGSVVMNRVASASFPNTIMQVIYQSGQFSPVASGRFAARLAAGANSTCRQAAQEVLNGNITVSCLYFRTDNGTIEGQIIGSHVFY